jgi:hypothetical protein
MRKKLITLLIVSVMSMSIVAPVAGQTNDVEIDGEISIDGSPATDGAQYQYEIKNMDAASDYTVNLTGSTATSWSNTSATGVSGSGSASVSTAGTKDPIGPASGEPELTLTARNDKSNTALDSFYLLDVGETKSVTFTPDAGTYDQFVFEVGNMFDTSATMAVRVDGTEVYNGNPDRNTFYVDISERSYDGSTSVTVEFEHLTGDGSIDVNQGAFYAALSSSVTLTADDGTSKSFDSLSSGDTRTVPFDLTSTASSVSFLNNPKGEFDIGVDLQQVAESQNPAITVNNNTVSYTGVLADGESVSLNVDPSWLKEGTNRVNVSVDGPSGGPTPRVGLEYDHRASYQYSTEYTGETFSERYNISYTFDSNRDAVTATIPFASSSVVAIRSIEARTGGGAWVDVNPEDRELDGSELTAQLGTVGAGEQVDVRAVGSKVRVENGAITVSEPTMLGDELNSKIVLDSVSSDTAIHVNSTAGGSETHYTHSESWAEPESYARFGTDGSQTLRFPNAGNGDVTRVSTLDMGVTPSEGYADVRVLEASAQPEFSLRESSTADQVTIQYRDTTSNHEYQLYSLDSEVARDTGVAQSPVELTSPGVPERLKIYNLGTTSGGGGGGAVGPTASRSFGANAAFLIGAAVAGIVALFFAARRWGSGGISSKAFFGVGVVTIGVVSLQVLAPNVLADYLGRAIESAFPLLLLGGVVVIVFWLRSRGDDTSIVIQGDSK